MGLDWVEGHKNWRIVVEVGTLAGQYTLQIDDNTEYIGDGSGGFCWRVLGPRQNVIAINYCADLESAKKAISEWFMNYAEGLFHEWGEALWPAFSVWKGKNAV